VLKVLAKYKNVPFKYLKDYFLNKIKSESELLEDNRYALELNLKKIA
jgi:hypothetical protein